jgi:glycosyltransferase involved in cell wall biosynthesis
MNICFLNMPIEYYSPVSGGAIATVIMQTSRTLLERGHHVHVLTITNGDELYPVGQVTPIEAKRREDLPRLLRYLSAIRRRLHRWDWPRYESYLGSFTRALRQLTPVPDAVVMFNDLVSPKYVKRVLPKAKVVVWLQNENRTIHPIEETARKTDAFITCSGYIRRWTSEHYNLPPERFTVAHNAADCAVFTPRPGYLDPVEELRVLFLGRIDPNKGPDIAADAVAALRREGVRISLTVGGGLWFYGHGHEMADPYFRSLKEKMDAAQANYVGHVTRHDAPALLREHDAACVLSRSHDPYPLVTIEAMASGCAVVAANRGGLVEACDEAGQLVNPDDLPAVIAALRRLATDPAYLRSEKEKSVRRAAREPWSLCAQRLEEVLS